MSWVRSSLRWLAGERARRAVELFVLTGLVVAQPLLDTIGRAPDFLVLHRLGRLDILLLVGAITFGPALGLWTAGLLIGMAGERAGWWAQVGTVTVLGMLLGVEAGKQVLPLRGALLVLVAIGVGLGIGWSYRRRGWLRIWLRYLAPAPLVFALLFMTASPGGRLVLASNTGPEAGQPAGDDRPRPPVVLVFFDEFPLQSLLDSHGRIDRRVYPNLAGVADRSTWYRNATGVSGLTQWAVPAMLTGRYPSKVKAPVAQQYPDNLFTLFARSYQLKVDELVTRLCPVERCGPGGDPTAGGIGAILGDTARLFGQVVSPYDHDADPAGIAGQPPRLTPQGGVPSSDQAARWARFLASIQRTDPQPTLYFEHVLLPHGPWQYLPDGTSYPADSYGLQLKETQYGQGVWDTNHERHLLQLGFVDHLVGQLVHRLQQQGLWDRALVVLTADHGNGFSVGETARRLGSDNAASLMWVPLLIKTPHQQAGRVDDRNWEQVDLLPTLADLVDLPVTWTTDGLSQTGPPQRQTTAKTWYDAPGKPRVHDDAADFARVLHGVTDTLVRGHQGQPGLYHYGSYGDWIGQAPEAVAQLADPERSPPTVTLANWTRTTTVDPASRRVPALLVGRLTVRAPPDHARIVVAINGRIGAVVEPFADRPRAKPTRFAAILPDFLFQPGPARPQVQLYLVEAPDGDPPLLEPLVVAN